MTSFEYKNIHKFLATREMGKSVQINKNRQIPSVLSRREIKTDQGWSWVILTSAFFGNMIFDGIIFTFGVFYIEFLDYFNEGRALTSWIGSVISAVYALIGKQSHFINS